MTTLKGKVAVVTGGSRGIGKAIALKLADMGADIAIIYAGNEEKANETCTELKALGVNSVAVKCDVSDFSDTKQAVSDIAAQLGTVDILVNNAGVTKDGLIMSMKEDAYDKVLDINLKGAFNMIKHCSSLFVKKRSGRIVNITSVSGIMGNAGQSNYSASKAGLIGLTKSVAKELASRNVYCNAVAPGFIETDMTENLDKNNALVDYIPLKRMGKPEEVAEVVAFLCTTEYITGEVIKIDGGLAM